MAATPQSTTIGPIVVRLPDRWLLTPLDADDVVPVSLEELTGLTAILPEPLEPLEPRLDTHAWVAPVEALVGEVTAGGVLVVDAHGPVLLDHLDLMLLDAVTGARPPVEVVADVVGRRGADVDEDTVLARLAALVDRGKLRWADGPLDHPGAVRELRAGRRPLARRGAADSTTPGGGTVPVYAVWPRENGPMLALGMLTAAARSHRDGLLNQWYDIRRPEDPSSFLADLVGRRGPAVLLCSNYLWSVEPNLEIARAAREINPELLVVHGGPSTPKYEADCEAFFARNPGAVDVTVRAEGEHALSELLEVLAGDLSGASRAQLATVPGLSYLDQSGAVVRTADRGRIDRLDELPSPYLTGEFDHLEPEAWNRTVNLETNRGCPYGCTFCDWGSVTLSRIRKFDLDRVIAEMTWAAERGIEAWVVSDANFGILARDVEITEHMVELRRRYGVPHALGFTVAKNTTRHLIAIVELLTQAGIQPHFGLSLQSRDPATLDAINRANISTDHYLELAAGIRRRGLPAYADLMLGLPGQTVDSFREDLQFLIDHEITARVWPTQLLPNAPMNDPAYRAEHRIEVSEQQILQATSTFDRADRAEMMALRHLNMAFEQFGLLRHVLRFLQWDHGLPATEVMARLLAVVEDRPFHYPLLTWVARYFDLFPVPPLGRDRFLADARRFVVEELGVPDDPALASAFAVQRALVPERGRRFPDEVELAHDYVTYYHDTTGSLVEDGSAPVAGRRLASYGPGRLEVVGDPLGRCLSGLGPYDRDPRDEAMMGELWISGHYELDSTLVRLLPEVAACDDFRHKAPPRPAGLAVVAEPVA